MGANSTVHTLTPQPPCPTTYTSAMSPQFPCPHTHNPGILPPNKPRAPAGGCMAASTTVPTAQMPHQAANQVSIVISRGEAGGAIAAGVAAGAHAQARLCAGRGGHL